jgi:hypothetical protein
MGPATSDKLDNPAAVASSPVTKKFAPKSTVVTITR